MQIRNLAGAAMLAVALGAAKPAAAQFAQPVPSVPATLAGNAAFTSQCLPSTNARAIDVAAGLSGPGTLSVQRYGDGLCGRPVGPALPPAAQALSQGAPCPGTIYCGDVGMRDLAPFLGFIITLTDTSGSTNNVRYLNLLNQGAN